MNDSVSKVSPKKRASRSKKPKVSVRLLVAELAQTTKPNDVKTRKVKDGKNVVAELELDASPEPKRSEKTIAARKKATLEEIIPIGILRKLFLGALPPTTEDVCTLLSNFAWACHSANVDSDGMVEVRIHQLRAEFFYYAITGYLRGRAETMDDAFGLRQRTPMRDKHIAIAREMVIFRRELGNIPDDEQRGRIKIKELELVEKYRMNESKIRKAAKESHSLAERLVDVDEIYAMRSSEYQQYLKLEEARIKDLIQSGEKSKNRRSNKP